ncbi:MAG TPA: flagellar biosynthesis protein FlhA [Anaeromyxobacter sp.]|nr:flagellar biosynthesis protein FlhA [Anaeromyxobacter sp.]
MRRAKERMVKVPGVETLVSGARAIGGRGLGEALLALAVLGLVVLLVVPLSPGALDALLALDLAASALLLTAALLAREPLRLSGFPALLLLTTLFRVALNVGSTRLILSRGEAGRVIEAFGRVVIQGNVVVGAVVFAILTLVQLLVVAKGAERVAEVAARFTLDALPGKQMSVDADLRAGLLDAAEARRRRRALERESQLYGAMDGALKFVKGDAIAGVAIVLVNVVGGLASGLLSGMTAAEAGRRYVLLAVGDGLSSQLAALLVAVAAGVAVTRVAADEDGAAVPTELRRQLLAEPGALVAVAVLLLALAAAPGLPPLPFLVVAVALLAGAAWSARRQRSAPSAVDERPGAREDPFAPAAPVTIELGPDLLAAAGPALAREGIAAIRAELWRALGVRLPPVAVRPGDRGDRSYRVLVDDVPIHEARLPPDEVVVLAPPDDLALVGIAARAIRDPASGRPAAAVAADDAARASALGPVQDLPERLRSEVLGALRHGAHHLLGVQEVQLLLDGLEPVAPALVREATAKLPAALVAEVLRQLLEEGVSIRPLRAILEAMLQLAEPRRGAAALAEACRRALRRQLGHAHAAGGPLSVLLLDPAAEQAIREALAGEQLALEPRRALALLDTLATELGAERWTQPPVVLVSPDVRRAVRSLLAPRFPSIPVLAYEELPPELPVRPVGRIGAAEAA